MSRMGIAGGVWAQDFVPGFVGHYGCPRRSGSGDGYTAELKGEEGFMNQWRE